MIRRRRSAAVAALTLGALVALAGCLPPLEQVTPTASGAWPGGSGAGPSSAPGDSSVYGQSLQWSTCGDLECTTVKVPLDWTDPNGQTITLHLNRSKARKPDERLGSVVINPGGPGGSGLDLTSSFVGFAGASLLDHYDIVGFDPRGVGLSTPIKCGTTKELDAYFTSQDIAKTAADVTTLDDRNAAFAAHCRELSGPLIENVDTASAARDMDVIRDALGDPKLNYLGFSYGTQLGATYAVLYPQNVGRFVLDGAVDFLLSEQELSEGQARGFESSLDAYIADCLTQANCPLPHDPDLAKRAIRDLVVKARDEGIPTGGETLNGTLIVYGIVVTLYSETDWQYLTQAFDEALNQGTGSMFLQLASFYLGRDANGDYQDNSTEAYTAITCLDTPSQAPQTIDDIRAFSKVAEVASPTFGWWFAAGVGCDGWPWHAHEIVQDLSPSGAAGPIVVVGTTGDPATPLAWARSLAGQMPSATLLVYDGQGHTAYGRSNKCILDTVDAYFVDGTVPDSGKTC
jgi:pimeloyl-ACP methyl ester carboxylesterase